MLAAVLGPYERYRRRGRTACPDPTATPMPRLPQIPATGNPRSMTLRELGRGEHAFSPRNGAENFHPLTKRQRAALYARTDPQEQVENLSDTV